MPYKKKDSKWKYKTIKLSEGNAGETHHINIPANLENSAVATGL